MKLRYRKGKKNSDLDAAVICCELPDLIEKAPTFAESGEVMLGSFVPNILERLIHGLDPTPYHF